MLETVPHQNIEDMAVVYRFALNSNNDGMASILVTNQLLNSMGVTPEKSSWRRENGKTIYEIEVPANTTATVRIGNDITELVEAGKHVFEEVSILRQ
jgi:hypothetical protein